MSNSQSRKWFLTINKPLESGLDHKAIIDILMLFFPDYFCGSDEIATTGTYHTHLFLYSQSPIRFSTVKKRFPTAHIEKALGSASQNRDYILKENKWAECDKSETSVENSFFEYGLLPQEGKEQGSKMALLIDNIKDWKRTAQIVEDLPSLGFRVRDIDVLRQTLLSERYSIENRNLEVIYIYGMTGAGKTRGIYERHSPRDICRITDYGKNGVRFDSYNGQEVLVFEEFSSQIPILATQRPSADLITGQVRSNIGTRICGFADDILSKIILDTTAAAEQIAEDEKGRFVTNTGELFQSYLFDENEAFSGVQAQSGGVPYGKGQEAGNDHS